MKNKRRNIIWALILIAAAVVVILDTMGINIAVGVSVWRIALGVLLVYAGVEEVAKGKYSSLPLILGILFLLFQQAILGEKLLSAWSVIFAALLLTVAVGLLTKDSSKRKIVVESDGDHKIGEKSVMYVDATDLRHCNIKSDLGSMDVFIENPNAYMGNGCISIENNLGAMNIHVPSSWHVVMQVDNSLGSVKCPPNPNGNGGPVLVIRGENNLGSVNIIFED